MNPGHPTRRYGIDRKI